jgi:hypothetical protein
MSGQHRLAGALPQLYDPIGPDLSKTFISSIRPIYQDTVDHQPIAQAKVHTHIVGAEIAAVGMSAPPHGALSLSNDSYARTDTETIQFGGFEADHQPMMTRLGLVPQ